MPITELHLASHGSAGLLCNEWNVFAVDLQNEPYMSSWGDGDPLTDWRLGSQVLGNHVLSRCPRWLIMIEGVADDPGAVDGFNIGHFWGENLEGARNRPARLHNMSKLVYSPHAYGPSLYDAMPYFLAPEFPNNMAAIWEVCMCHAHVKNLLKRVLRSAQHQSVRRLSPK